MSKLTFEPIDDRTEKIQQNMHEIKLAWNQFKSEYNEYQTKQKHIAKINYYIQLLLCTSLFLAALVLLLQVLGLGA
tara:strand:- start:370 stop:597 length:228 start_codon:yes stop_codon:yes gene_type:complete